MMVMWNASNFKGYDERTLELSNAALRIKQDTTSIEKHPLYNSSTPLQLPAVVRTATTWSPATLRCCDLKP